VKAENVETSENTGFSRRKALKVVGAGGLTAGVGLVPTVSAGGDDEIEIVVTKERDCVAETRKVPSDWYSHTEQARSAKDSLAGDLEGLTGIHSISRGREEESIEEFSKHNIIVRVSADFDKDVLPDEVDGIPVKVEESERIGLDCNNYYNVEPSGEIYGGIRWDAQDGDCGTLCCRVQWENNGSWEEFIMSSRHVITDQFCDHNDPNGQDWNQYDTTKVGTVEKEWQKYDTVLLNLDDTSRDISPDIVNESRKVVGRVTQNGLDCFKSKNTTIRKRGISTGLELDSIEETGADSWDCTYNNNINGLFITNHDRSGGDSGGPHYYEDDNGYLYLAGMHMGYYDPSEALAISADHIESNENIWFGGNEESGSCS
jgi:hypothetical protein